MKSTNRFGLSNFKKVIEEKQIPGNFTSVEGAYYIPGIDTLGFYKKNGCMLAAQNDEDLRELLASEILKSIEEPHAEIVPVFDEQEHNNGCLSLSILKKGEQFAPLPFMQARTKPITTVKEYIEQDLKDIEKLPNITPEIMEDRRKYLARYLFLSALLSNTDIKSDNCQMIYSEKTGQYRNPDYYDAGLSFIFGEYNTFFDGKAPETILRELYKDYAQEILPLAKKVEEKLTQTHIDELLSNSIYNGFKPNVKQEIAKGLKARVNCITKYNQQEDEKAFLANFSHNANLSDQLEDYISSGFFHMTPFENIGGEEGIERVGLKAAIGENSQGYEKYPRTYYSIGALGVAGIINRLIYLTMQKKNLSKEDAFKSVSESLSKSVYLKMNIEDGIDYDSTDFMTRRNSHTITGHSISPEKLELLTVDGNANALKILDFLCQHCDINKIRRETNKDRTEYLEDNYLEEFLAYVHEKGYDNRKVQVNTNLKKLALEDREQDKKGFTEQEIATVTARVSVEAKDEANKRLNSIQTELTKDKENENE